MLDDHRSAMPQVKDLDDPFGTYRLIYSEPTSVQVHPNGSIIDVFTGCCWSSSLWSLF
jgi:hypothetical protein